MTDEQFDALIERRDDLRARHESLCESCNEGFSPFRGEQPGVPSRERDRVWAQLQIISEQIEAVLAAEAEAE